MSAQQQSLREDVESILYHLERFAESGRFEDDRLKNAVDGVVDLILSREREAYRTGYIAAGIDRASGYEPTVELTSNTPKEG